MKLKFEIQKQHRNEKATFGGMFDRSRRTMSDSSPILSARFNESSSDVGYTRSRSVEQAKEYLRDAECAAIRLFYSLKLTIFFAVVIFVVIILFVKVGASWKHCRCFPDS
jgi:hypothetical protein